MTTVVAPEEILPLTCTRSGACCHGKEVWINPWELATIAAAHGGTARDLLLTHTIDGGIRLLFSGHDRWRNLPACAFYCAEHGGCSVYAGRPLACRLYPLGRRRHGDQVSFIHHGTALPCLDSCPDVTTLPLMKVASYVAGQETAVGIAAQDAYMDVVADLGEAAFAVAVDSGLLRVRAAAVIAAWALAAKESPAARATALGSWLERLLLPETGVDLGEPQAWIAAHRHHLQQHLSMAFAYLNVPAEVQSASVTCLRLGLHLAQSCAADVAALALTWRQRLTVLAQQSA